MAAALVAYVVAFRGTLFGAPAAAHSGSAALDILSGVGAGLHALGVVLGLLSLIAYAVVSSVLMVWAARFVWAPLLLHGVVAGAIVVDELHEHARRDAAEAALRATPEYQESEQRRQLESCVWLEAEVRAAAPLRATVAVHNRDCPFELVVNDVDLTGFYASGNLMFRATDRAPLTTIAPGHSHRFALAEIGVKSAWPESPTWAWRSNVDFETVAIGIPCYATPGAPAAQSCHAMGRVVVTR